MGKKKLNWIHLKCNPAWFGCARGGATLRKIPKYIVYSYLMALMVRNEPVYSFVEINVNKVARALSLKHSLFSHQYSVILYWNGKLPDNRITYYEY